MQHTVAYRRHETYRHIAKKQRIITEIKHGSIYNNAQYKGNKLSKGKVHCSCPMCSSKTRRNGWKHADLVALSKGYEL